MRTLLLLSLVGLVACTRGVSQSNSSQSGSSEVPSSAGTGEANKVNPDASIQVAAAAASDPAPSSSEPAACRTDDECGWTEFDKEIPKRADCMCLLGCPHIAVSTATIARRTAQYRKYCEPQKDGNGRPCPIDDCSRPPPAVCKKGKCGAP